MYVEKHRKIMQLRNNRSYDSTNSAAIERQGDKSFHASSITLGIDKNALLKGGQ